MSDDLDVTAPLGKAQPGDYVPMAAPPARVGPYAPRALLGSGGYGSVYLADDVRSGASAALKLVKVSSRDQREGIRREIHALHKLDHPGIVRILDHGVHEGMPWYAMEHLQGKTLLSYRESLLSGPATATGATPEDAETLRVSRETPREAAPAEPRAAGQGAPALLAIVRRLCAPLAYMHGEGLVHRDLKPANVIVRDDGQPVVVDFGLAVGATVRERLGESTMAGTPAYMAPEQARGEAVDPRADLYAVGCILFELLSGRLPFDGAAAQQLVFRHRRLEAPRLAMLVPGISPELDALVARLLAPEPAARPGYAEDVDRELGALGVANGSHGSRRGRAYLYRPGFAGRGEPVERVRRWMDGTRDPGSPGRLVLVSGPSGIGKTRLLNEVATRIAFEGAEVLSCELGREGAPLSGFRPALELIADRLAERGSAGASQFFPRGGARLAAYEPTLAAIVPPESGAPGANLEHLMLDLEDALGGLAADRPLLLILDDLQWADSLTLSALARIRPRRTLLLGAFRAEEGLPRALDESERLELGSLETSSVAALARDMLGGAELPATLREAIPEACEGNPLFAGEYLRTLLHAGSLVRDDRGAWRLREEPHVAAPRRLREILDERLALLSEPARAVARLAAAIGREPSPSVLAIAAEALGVDHLEGTAELAARHVMEETSRGVLRFAHDRMREAAYDSIPEAQRPRTHAAVADAIDARREEVEQADAALALHRERAGDHPRAALHHRAAAELARTQFATDEAIRHYEGYLRLSTEPATSERAMAQVRLGALCHQSGRRDEALGLLERAIEEARRLGDGRVEAEGYRALGWARRERMEHREARRAYERAIELFDAAGVPVESAASLGDLATVVQNQGELVEAVGMYEKAIAALEALGETARAERTELSLASAYSQLGAFEKAGVMFEEAVARYRERDPRALAVAIGGLAIVRSKQERPEEALELLAECLLLYERVLDVRGQLVTLNWTGLTWLDRGNPVKAREFFERCIALAGKVGARWEETAALVRLADVQLELGERRAARETLHRALAIARDLARKDLVEAVEGRLATIAAG